MLIGKTACKEQERDWRSAPFVGGGSCVDCVLAFSVSVELLPSSCQGFPSDDPAAATHTPWITSQASSQVAIARHAAMTSTHRNDLDLDDDHSTRHTFIPRFRPT